MNPSLTTTRWWLGAVLVIGIIAIALTIAPWSSDAQTSGSTPIGATNNKACAGDISCQCGKTNAKGEKCTKGCTCRFKKGVVSVTGICGLNKDKKAECLEKTYKAQDGSEKKINEGQKEGTASTKPEVGELTNTKKPDGVAQPATQGLEELKQQLNTVESQIQDAASHSAQSKDGQELNSLLDKQRDLEQQINELAKPTVVEGDAPQGPRAQPFDIESAKQLFEQANGRPAAHFAELEEWAQANNVAGAKSLDALEQPSSKTFGEPYGDEQKNASETLGDGKSSNPCENWFSWSCISATLSDAGNSLWGPPETPEQRTERLLAPFTSEQRERYYAQLEAWRNGEPGIPRPVIPDTGGIGFIRPSYGANPDLAWIKGESGSSSSNTESSGSANRVPAAPEQPDVVSGGRPTNSLPTQISQSNVPPSVGSSPSGPKPSIGAAPVPSFGGGPAPSTGPGPSSGLGPSSGVGPSGGAGPTTGAGPSSGAAPSGSGPSGAAGPAPSFGRPTSLFGSPAPLPSGYTPTSPFANLFPSIPQAAPAAPPSGGDAVVPPPQPTIQEIFSTYATCPPNRPCANIPNIPLSAQPTTSRATPAEPPTKVDTSEGKFLCLSIGSSLLAASTGKTNSNCVRVGVPPNPLPRPNVSTLQKNLQNSSLTPVASLLARNSSIESGATTTLTWASVMTESCIVFDGEGEPIGSGGSDGSIFTAPLSSTTSFTVSCLATDGSTVGSKTTVLVH